jgi:hypothetical protein
MSSPRADGSGSSLASPSRRSNFRCYFASHRLLLVNRILHYRIRVAHVAAGTLFIKLGQTGLNFLNAIMIADLTPLEWRGFWTGFLSTPYSSFRFFRFSVGVESPTDVRFVLVCPRSHQRFVQPSLASSRRCVH